MKESDKKLPQQGRMLSPKKKRLSLVGLLQIESYI